MNGADPRSLFSMNSFRPVLLSAAVLAGASGLTAADSVPFAAPTVTVPAAPHPLAAYTAVGAAFGKSSRLHDLGWSEAEFAAFLEGVKLAYRGDKVPFDENTQRLYAEMGQRIKDLETRERQKLFSDPAWIEKYMKDAVKKFGLQRSDSGLAFGVTAMGKGVRPGPDDTVVISANVTAADGATELPQLTIEKKKFKVSELVPGVAEGVQMMTLDSRGMFVVPPDLSYGNGEWPKGVERGAPLLFMIVLHEVIAADAAP